MKNAADIGITNRKIIVSPCIVKTSLYVAAFKSVPSGCASCDRINSASMPPTMKKTNAVAPYISPIFLWSTVVNQLQKPVSADGRRMPRPRSPEIVMLAIYPRSVM